MTKRKLVITGPAKNDLKEIRAYSIDKHGRKTADAYDALIKQAIKDLRTDPLRVGSRERPEIAETIRTYHISLSRNAAGSPIKTPRHFVLYFLPKADELVISRILYDGRDLPRHLPDEHRRAMQRARYSSKQKPSRDKGRTR